MKISLAYVTFNIPDSATSCLQKNIASAGYPIHEIIHFDNGSYPENIQKLRDGIPSTIRIESKENGIVTRAYNIAMMISTGSHILITQIDKLLPQDWLKTMVEHFEAIPQTGVISAYCSPAMDDHSMNRYYGPQQVINGKTIQPSMAMEVTMLSRKTLLGAGFLREDFGSYGMEDLEWGERLKRYADENGLINYIIPTFTCSDYFGPDYHFNMPDGRSYHEWKRDKIVPTNIFEPYLKCSREGFPYYNPYNS